MVGGREGVQEEGGEWLEGGGWVTHRGFAEIGCKVKTKRARGTFAFCGQHLPRLGTWEGWFSARSIEGGGASTVTTFDIDHCS